ncbi:MAG: hypothetical protein ABJB12_15925, partial [Pseudomonadota bacterium]
LFDEDAFAESGPLNLELSTDAAPGIVDFGGSIDFDATGGFELEPAVPPAAQNSGPTSAVARRAGPTPPGSASWPSGRAPDAETLAIDPLEIAILADYGAAPHSAHRTPAYAYRVFTRQRELKAQLLSLCAERERAELERETVLAELTRTMRPMAEQMDGFRRFFTPIIELEQVASQRGQALSFVNAELSAQSSTFDAELRQIAELRAAQQAIEQAALRAHSERELLAQRAEAKLKRAHIEIRAVTQVAEQKLGAQGGQIPEPEASQLVTLRQRVDAIAPEVTRAKSELEQASQALRQARNKLDSLHQAERATARKKQALADRFQKEVQVRSAGLSESETQQRAALAEGGRALLASRGALPIDAAWLEQVRAVSERADRLIIKCETLRRALDAYDRARVTQGVRLACTALGLLILLLVLKIAL